MESLPTSSAWPQLLAECCRALHGGPSAAGRDALRGKTWVLLQSALMRFLRARVRSGYPAREDLEDIASAKALELLSRAESGVWSPDGRSTDEIVGYVARVARNGLVDFVRRTGREIPAADGPGDDDDFEPTAPRSGEPLPEMRAESRELARALRECAERLQPQARRVWFFRAFYEMTSREIASHPDVRLNAPHVDVVAQRARQSIRACLEARGLDANDVPAGAFVELWSMLESLGTADPGAAHEEQP